MNNKEHLKDKKYRLNRIEFGNYKGYGEAQTINLTTTRKFEDDRTTVPVVWKSGNTVKYKNVIGVWGKNASGKSSIIEIMEKWDEIFRMINSNGQMNNFGELRDKALHSQRISNHISRGENPAQAIKYSTANDPSKPVWIKLTFETDEYVFSYMVSEEEKVINNSIQGRLFDKIEIFYKTKRKSTLKNGEIWSSKKFGSFFPQVYSFVQTYLNRDSYKMDKERVAELVVGLGRGKLTKQEAINFIDNIKLISEIWDILYLYNLNNRPVETGNSSCTSDGYLMSISNSLAMLHNGMNVSVRLLEEVTSKIISSLDSNVVRANLTISPVTRTSNSSEKEITDIWLSSVVSKTGKEFLPEELSQGTLLLLDLFLVSWKQSLVGKEKWPNATKYLFIDELGQNWHTNLSTAFIDMVANGTFGNLVLLFTSHDANIGDALSPDSVYVIDNEGKIDSLESATDKESLRKNKKFSRDYLNSVTDIYSTNPDLEELMSVGGLINE